MKRITQQIRKKHGKMSEKLVSKSMLIDEIIVLSEKNSSTSDLKNDLIVLFSKYDIYQAETAVAIRGEEINEQIIRKFIIAKRVKGLTDKTLKYYYHELHRTLNGIGKPFDQILADDIILYLAKKQINGTGSCTADNTRRILKSFYNWCLINEYIAKDPTVKIEKIKFRNKKEKAFTELEVEKLRGACRDTREKCLIEFLLSTGCRATEVAHMRIDDINGNKVTIHGKGNKDRIGFLNAKAMFALDQYLKDRSDQNPYLFPRIKPCTMKGGSLFLRYQDPSNVIEGHARNDNINQYVKAVGKRAGVLGVHTHRFRRTCATHALQRGMPIEMISMMLGHEQLTTTQIYLSLDERDLERSHEKYVT